ncbi:hypothetical protein GCM10027040_20160 [Halomonas shantousis]
MTRVSATLNEDMDTPHLEAACYRVLGERDGRCSSLQATIPVEDNVRAAWLSAVSLTGGPGPSEARNDGHDEATGYARDKAVGAGRIDAAPSERMNHERTLR